MSARKRRKNTRLRGSHTHSWGEKKHHRKAGSRGGKGNAGSGKRADQRKPIYWLEGRKTKYGFKSINPINTKAINVGDLTLMIEKGQFEKKGQSFDVNLTSRGFTKLLSKGLVKYPMDVTVSAATEKAVEKVAEKGGKVTLPKAE